jgi:D-alanyl-D-alanine carboxypeptidase
VIRAGQAAAAATANPARTAVARYTRRTSSTARLLIVAGSWIAGGAASGADLVAPAAKRLDAYFDALAQQQFANGTIAISEKGVLRYQRSIGSARLSPNGNEPTDAATRYRIGPVSQLFTAVLVMQLVEGASVTLDSKLAEFYPDLPNALDITYRDLLQHRSGLANYTDLPDFETWRTSARTHADLLKIIEAGGAKFPPRERVDNNGTNYLLLGYVLEKIYERSFDEIVQRQITGKLGLARTYYAGNGITSLESTSYRLTPAGWMAQAPTDPSIHGGAGGMLATPADLVVFIDAVFTGKLVTPHSLESMRSQEGGSGMGLWPHEIAGHTGYGQSGSTEGFRACVYYFSDRELAISYATNASILPMDEMVDETLSLVFEHGRKPPSFEPVKLTSHQQADYTGTWRSTEGSPAQLPFRPSDRPDVPISLVVKPGTDAPLVTLEEHVYPLTALGNHEFALRALGYFLRFNPRDDELVIRGPERAYNLRRAR